MTHHRGTPDAVPTADASLRAADRRRLVRHVAAILLRMVVMLWLVTTITFVVVRALPGNPIDLYIQDLAASGLSPEEARSRASAVLRFDVQGSFLEQYVQYVTNVTRGDLGNSSILSPGSPVLPMILARLPWTILSVGIALTLSFIIGVRLGLIAAMRRHAWTDHLISNTWAAIDSIPAVLLAVVAILLLGVVWKIVPIEWMRGAYDPATTPGFNWPFIKSALLHYLVPGTVYTLTSLGGWVLAMRSNAMSAISDDYVHVARARGLGEPRIRDAYVGRNAILPLVTGFAIAVGFTVSGSVLIEKVFVTPGVGALLADAIARRDYPLMQGVVLITTFAVLVATAVADALSTWLDPRIRLGGDSA
ncbi:ABC transporter permease [Deinococcus yavapaiensis]|uniref:Peptide/nickel transport system permease protein n=1 Tax=Deinococcus yavapaiensis KR-236 TaxID=694435 RepID=A0A318SII0_9DEIO|nr:ABC transporter permease [Deinococcus yavapaiensis]PYE53867.1 peptide/nickel transport system permease protein [Deinococcus yavapaiensis KR-236]